MHKKLFYLIPLGIIFVCIVIFYFTYPLVMDFLWFSDLGFSPLFFYYQFLPVSNFLLGFLYYYLFMSFYSLLRLKKTLFNYWFIHLAFAIGLGVFLYIQNPSWIYLFTPDSLAYKDPFLHLNATFYLYKLPIIDLIWQIHLFLLLVISGIEIFSLADRKKNVFMSVYLKCLGTILLLWFLLGIFLSFLGDLITQKSGNLGIDFYFIYGVWTGKTIFIAFCFVILLCCIWFNLFKNGKRLLYIGVFLITLFLLSIELYPWILKRYYLPSNELRLQKPFIEDKMQATKFAFGLENMVRDTKNAVPLSSPLDKVRIWDIEPYQKVIKEMQSIQNFFDFNNTNLVMYEIDGEKYLTFTSPREISIDKLPSNVLTWENKTFRYTHGFGAVISPTHIVNEKGEPTFWVQNLENKASYPELEIKIPEIYFGLNTNYPVVTHNTHSTTFLEDEKDNKVPETGIKLSSFSKKLLTSFILNEKKYIFTSYLTKDSKLLLHRNVLKRINKLFPDAAFETKPYLANVDGELYWFIEGYTFSDRFPISDTSLAPYNYVRAPFLAVISAFDGKTHIYMTEEDNPLALVWNKFFPNLIEKEIPEKFEKHIRYPYTLFTAQQRVLTKYHTDNAEAFYNGENLWSIPTQIYGDKIISFSSYYLLLEEKENTYLGLMAPFTPFKKENLAGWMTGYTSGKNRFLTLNYTKANTSILGPMQVESKLNQDDTLSGLFTLWGQEGSRLFRGNIQFFTNEDKLIYLEPIFLESEGFGIPQLVRYTAVNDGTVYQDKDPAKVKYALNQEEQFIKERTDYKTILQELYKLYLDAETNKVNQDMKAYQDTVDKIGETIKQTLEKE